MTDEVQVIEFELGNERYCIDIDHVAEIVRRDEGDITPVPNSPRHIKGVVDLRGKTTQIVDPFVLLNIQGGAEEREQIMVFDADGMDGENVGWLVDEVYRVTQVSPDDVEDAPNKQDGIQGVVNRDEGFLIWTEPTLAHT